jgi:hypothetical protein
LKRRRFSGLIKIEMRTGVVKTQIPGTIRASHVACGSQSRAAATYGGRSEIHA